YGEVDAAEEKSERLTEGDEAERGARKLDRRDVEIGRVTGVMVENVSPKREDDDAENEHRCVVALDEAQDLRPAPDPIGHALCCMRRGADLGLDDVLLGDLVAVERHDRVAA